MENRIFVVSHFLLRQAKVLQPIKRNGNIESMKNAQSLTQFLMLLLSELMNTALASCFSEPPHTARLSSLLNCSRIVPNSASTWMGQSKMDLKEIFLIELKIVACCSFALYATTSILPFNVSNAERNSDSNLVSLRCHCLSNILGQILNIPICSSLALQCLWYLRTFAFKPWYLFVTCTLEWVTCNFFWYLSCFKQGWMYVTPRNNKYLGLGCFMLLIAS